VFYIVVTIHLILCFVLIGLVLLQQGKGAELGATLGGGSNTLLGAGGATSLVTKLTTGIALSFMVTSILLVRTYNRSAQQVTSGADALLEGSLLEEEAPAAAPVTQLEGKEEIQEGEIEKEAAVTSPQINENTPDVTATPAESTEQKAKDQEAKNSAQGVAPKTEKN
jgi:preprotein translocase subunit SecG